MSPEPQIEDYRWKESNYQSHLWLWLIFDFKPSGVECLTGNDIHLKNNDINNSSLNVVNTIFNRFFKLFKLHFLFYFL